ncbi:methyltransferase domain-containing protein [Sesbania bispinosa]|nr:methyltransferase domain-containing protein [Sesbania bispinosa]
MEKVGISPSSTMQKESRIDAKTTTEDKGHGEEGVDPSLEALNMVGVLAKKKWKRQARDKSDEPSQSRGGLLLTFL